MWSRNKPPDNEPSGPQDDPLNQFTAPTVRQKIDRDATQPLNPQSVPPNEGGDFSNRRQDRLERQTSPLGGGSRVYPTNVRTFVQNVNNRQLFIIGGVILLLLVGLLVLRNIGKSATKTKAATPTPALGLQAPQVTPAAQVDTTSVAGTGFTTLPALGDATSAPSVGGVPGKTFVVFNTANLGLKVHDKPTVSASTIATFPDGTKVTVTGDSEQQADGHSWVKVKGPQGEGWVAKDFLQPGQ
ncbi:MAG: SH3 domain-containing protein [Herpetosiphonaceae bacterium]|nr:SH3 domain-containing protein [Herpetosiphonaceae bacterium]